MQKCRLVQSTSRGLSLPRQSRLIFVVVVCNSLRLLAVPVMLITGKVFYDRYLHVS